MDLRPTDAAACAALLGESARERRSLRVRGGGTKSYVGELLPTDAVLDTTGMSGIVDHVPADLTVTVAGGTRLADVRAALLERGQILPLDPPHADQATIGGLVAANSNGFGRLRYGGVRDLLIGTALALADGTVARAGGRVVKNVAGYDLNKLVIGSLGTLAVVAEATFKVQPAPPARALAAVRCREHGEAFSVASAIVRTALRPSAAVVSGGPDGWTALIGAEGRPAEVERAMAETARAAAQAGARSERSDDPEAALGPLRELPATTTDGALVRAALPLAAQPAFVDIARRLEVTARVVADAGSGIVRVHLRGPDDAVIHGADALLAAAAAVGGSARVERRDATLADRLGAWAAARPGGDFLMRRIKEAFDPAGILEPGRSIVG